MRRIQLLASALLIALLFTSSAFASRVKEGVAAEVKMSGGSGPTGTKAVGDFQILHSDGFKGAHRVAVSVFNVAFPDENTIGAHMRNQNRYLGYSADVTIHTKLQGVDQATRQRIADAAYVGFLDELKRAGFEVVSAEELARLAPEFTTWTSVPNFSQGRFGTYVAPTGRVVRWLQGDTAKRDISSKSGELFSPFRALDRPQAFTRSPYLAYDGKLGIIAVTLVVDYGLYSTSGNTKNIKAGATAGFLPRVSIQSGTLSDTATLAEYWGPKSGGFAAIAALSIPIKSELPFAEVSELPNVTVKADPVQFEAAALEVVRAANAKLVGAIAAQR